ncbi:FAD-dependent oxidoreductase [Tsukamurella soli]|uniref:FAD-dependent oxidoreductase n=3 Tax=Tsukamurella soli TaxID=644556 RepID=A0ABP8JH08_9ACTN
MIVGAGPTGLTAALELARRGHAVRIVDAASGPFDGSRGKGVTARTQEVFDDLGIVEPLQEAGFRHLPMRVSVGGDVRFDADPAAAAVPTPDRPYESGLLLPQWRTEQILRDRLGEYGVHVEYGLTATSVDDRGDHARVAIEGDGDAAVTARYVIGCDGGHSTSRGWVGATFEGHGGPQALLIADVRVAGLTPDRWYQWTVPETGFAALCPFRTTDRWQFQGLLFQDYVDFGGLPEPTLERVQRTVDQVTGSTSIRLSDPTWMSRWRVNVRLADRFRRGRVFLAGDAAHVHSPAGGLGMNTGIQDAYNLGWKLAAVLGGDADAALLDTYAEERIPVAQWTLGMSNRGLEDMSQAVTDPAATRLMTPHEDGQQLGLGYRWSSLSSETPGFAARTGSPARAGDRAPDAPLRGPDGAATRLFDAYRGPHATVVALGDAAADGVGLSDTGVPVVTVGGPDGDLTDAAGHARQAYGSDGLFVVRPDGYIGFAGVSGDGDAARDYLARITGRP